MKVNFNFEIKQPSGEIIKVKDENKEEKALLSGSLIVNCLMNDQFKQSDKIKKFLLACKIEQEKEFEIDKADFGLIKKAVEFDPSPVSIRAAAPILLKFQDILAKNADPIKENSKK